MYVCVHGIPMSVLLGMWSAHCHGSVRKRECESEPFENLTAI